MAADLPPIGATVSFVSEQHLFTGVVIKSYGFGVAIRSALTGEVKILENDSAIPFHHHRSTTEKEANHGR